MNIIPIKQSIINKFNQNNFIYLGINLSAFTDTKGDIKKKICITCWIYGNKCSSYQTHI